MTSIRARAARAACLVLLAMAGFAALPAGANLVFQQQTNVSCAACHQPAKEQLGREGLTEAGQAFLACGYRLRDCFSPSSGRPVSQLLSPADAARAGLAMMPAPTAPNPLAGSQTAPQPQRALPPLNPGAANPQPGFPAPQPFPSANGFPAPQPAPGFAAPAPAPAPAPVAQAAALPRGPYQQTCRDLRLIANNKTLLGTCQGPNFAQIRTALDITHCQTEVFVDNGYLRCGQTTGSMSSAWRWFEVVNRQAALEIQSLKVRAMNTHEDWKESLKTPIRANGGWQMVYLPPAAGCLQRIRIGDALGNEKESVDTCYYRRMVVLDTDVRFEQ